MWSNISTMQKHYATNGLIAKRNNIFQYFFTQLHIFFSTKNNNNFIWLRLSVISVSDDTHFFDAMSWEKLFHHRFTSETSLSGYMYFFLFFTMKNIVHVYPVFVRV